MLREGVLRCIAQRIDKNIGACGEEGNATEPRHGQAQAALGRQQEASRVNRVIRMGRHRLPQVMSVRGRAGDQAARLAARRGGGVGQGEIPIVLEGQQVAMERVPLAQVESVDERPLEVLRRACGHVG